MSPKSVISMVLLIELVKFPNPKIYVSKWIDYTHKYGLAYQLSDESVGGYFNDKSTLILAPNGR